MAIVYDPELEKWQKKRKTFNLSEYEDLSREIVNYINDLDLSSHSKGRLHNLLQKFYRDTVTTYLLKELDRKPETVAKDGE